MALTGTEAASCMHPFVSSRSRNPSKKSTSRKAKWPSQSLATSSYVFRYNQRENTTFFFKIPFFCLLVVSFCCSMLLHPAVAIEDSMMYTANAKYLRQFMRFEFGKGASADVTVDWNANVMLPLRVYVCDATQMSYLLQNYDSIEEICMDLNNTAGCEAVLFANDGLDLHTSLEERKRGQTWKAIIDRDVILNLHYLTCKSVTTKITMRFKLINPGGEQLGMGQVPLKTMYLASFFLWISFTLLVFVDLTVALVCRGLRPLLTTLHFMILTTMVLTVANCGIEMQYWSWYSEHGKTSINLRDAGDIASGLRTALVLTNFMLIAKGWKVTVAGVSGRDWRTILMLLCMYGFIYAFYDVYGGTFFPLFMLGLAFFVMLRYVKRSLKENLHYLRHQLAIMRTVLRLHPSGSPVLKNFKTLAICQRWVPIILMVHLCCAMWDMTQALHEQPEWIGHLFYQMWTIVSVIFMYVAFRLKGRVIWNARTLDQVNAELRARRERQELELVQVGRKMSGPVSKPEAFSEAIFLKIGSDAESENSSDRLSDINSVAPILFLATSPWQVNAGTFLVEQTDIENSNAQGMTKNDDRSDYDASKVVEPDDVVL